MTVSPTKWNSLAPKPAFGFLGNYQVLLYGRALHPEPFQLRARRVLKEPAFEAEGWLMRGSHVLCFRRGYFCASELVTSQNRDLPTAGLVSGFLCSGEHEFDHKFGREACTYYTSVQSETMNETLYRATYDEMIAFGQEKSSLVHVFEDESGPCVSMLDFEAKATSVHIDSYHLLATGGIVLKTQSLFELPTSILIN